MSVSDETTPPATDEEDQQQADQTGTPSGTPAADTDWQAESEKWRSLSRKNEAKAKANSTAAGRLAELEERDKSEQQKLTDRAEAAEKRVQEFEAKQVRLDVAARKGLTAEQAEWLTGSEDADLESQADRLLAAFPKAPPVHGSADAGPRPTGPDYDGMSITELANATRP